jgi:acyl-CoA synthetase (AMP-forming)/AMP-acid ligase II
VNPTTGTFHLEWMLRDADPVLVVAQPGNQELVRSLTRAGVAGPDAWLEQAPAGLPPRTGRGADLALLMYTSGSTGLPRAVMCPAERVTFAAAAINERLGYRAGDIVLSRVPVSFDYGLYQLFLCAAGGAELVLRPDLPEAAVLQQVARSRATVLPLVPALTQVLLRLAERRPSATALRLMTNTGGPLTKEHANRLRDAFPGASVVAMYGMTECKRITVAAPDEHLRHPGTVGRALRGTVVCITDAGGRDLAPGETGQIRVSGPHVMAGYWRAPDQTRHVFAMGPGGTELRTGDLGYLDSAGRLYFVGRQDDIFKRRGVRMNPYEVEEALRDVPGVREAVVLRDAVPGGTGTAGDARGEGMVAVVLGDVTGAEVLRAAAIRLDPARVPDRCVVVDALPATANGKVDRSALQRLVRAPAGGEPAAREPAAGVDPGERRRSRVLAEPSTPNASPGRIRWLVAKLRQIPDSARSFTVSTESAVRDRRLPARLLTELAAHGLPHGGTAEAPLFDTLDLTNAALQLGCGVEGRSARRLWPAALRSRFDSLYARYAVRYSARCLDGTHEGACQFSFSRPGGGIDVRTADGPGASVEIVYQASTRTSWPTVPPQVRDVLALADELDFFLLPLPLSRDVDFIRRTGLGHCAGVSSMVVEAARSRGLEARRAFGLLVTPPYGTGHFWTEFKVDGVWVPVDPLIVQQLVRWQTIDASEWPRWRSPGAIFVRLAGDDVPIAEHEPGRFQLSIGATLARDGTGTA